MEIRKPSDEEKSFCKRVMKVMVSHVGLFITVAVYAVVGAYVFQDIEKDHTKMQNNMKRKTTLDIRDSKNYIVNDMWYQNSQNHSADDFKAIAMNNLNQFHDFVVKGVSNFNYDGDLDSEVNDWTFTNALIFTFTTIAAIGYGHISPKTFKGQMFAIFYGLVGVPLLLVFLANIGDPLARAFRYTYSRGCCLWCRMTRSKKEVRKGMPPKNVFKETVGPEVYMPTDEVQVPITATVCLLSVYLMLGGILFGIIDGWQFHQAAYFSFITLSTIGFGDFVPGQTDSGDTSNMMAVINMTATVGFSLFGMALLSMCINLIQEQIVNKFRWMAKELGMTDKKEEKNKTKLKYQKTDLSKVTITPPDKDGNQDLLKPKDEQKEKKKFKRREYRDDDDEESEFDSL